MDSIPRAELDVFRNIVAARLGLQFDDTKMDLLADVFRQRLEARGRISSGSVPQRAGIRHEGARRATHACFAANRWGNVLLPACRNTSGRLRNWSYRSA